METSIECTEHLKLCKFYCPRHTDILCSQCTVKYHHRSCHLSYIDELLSNSYYSPLVKHAHESVTDRLEIIQQRVHDMKQNHNTERANSVTNHNAGKVYTETNHNTGSDNSETKFQMVECSKQYDSVKISIVTRMNELKGSDMTKGQFCFVVTTFRFLFTSGNILQNVKKYFHTNECCISLLKSCQQLIIKFHLHIRMKENICLLLNISSYSIDQPLSNNSSRVVIEVNRKVILQKGERQFLVTSCWFMPDSKMVFLVTFVDTLDKSLIIHDLYGSYIQSIPIYGRIWDVTPVGIDKIIVRYIDWNWFEVLDFSLPNRVKSRRLRQISFKNDLRFSSSDNSFVDVYHPSGEIITSFPVGKDRVFAEICSDKSNIYYIDKKRNILNCVRKDDTFKRMCKFDYNLCITSVVAIGNGYVLLTGKHNLAVLNFDHRIRQNAKVDGAENFNDMWTSFNRTNNTLLVCSGSDDFALLYDVKSAEN